MNNFTAMLICAVICACLMTPWWFGALYGFVTSFFVCVILDVMTWAFKKLWRKYRG